MITDNDIKAVQKMAVEDAVEILINGKMFESAERYIGLKHTDEILAMRYREDLYEQLTKGVSARGVADILIRSHKDLIKKIEIMHDNHAAVNRATKEQHAEFKLDLENKFNLRGRDIAKDIVKAPHFVAIFGEVMGIAGNGLSSSIEYHVSPNLEDQTIKIHLTFEYSVVKVDDES